MDDDPPRFTLLGRHDDDEQPDDDLEDDADAAARRLREDRRTKVVALTGLAVVVVIVAVVIALVRLVDTGDGAAPSPDAAAQRWVSAAIRGDHRTRQAVECSGGSRATRTVASLLAEASHARVGASVARGAGRWDVPVTIRYPVSTLEQSLDLRVVRQRGRYLVC